MESGCCKSDEEIRAREDAAIYGEIAADILLGKEGISLFDNNLKPMRFLDLDPPPYTYTFKVNITTNEFLDKENIANYIARQIYGADADFDKVEVCDYNDAELASKGVEN